MREQLMDALKHTKADAKYWVRRFSEEGTFRSNREAKSFVEELLQNAESVALHPNISDTIMLTDRIGVSLEDFGDNIFYETPEVEEFIEYVSKYNPYHKVFIKVDRENKTITFKLGDRSKTLELIEHSDYVSRPYRRKYMQCVTVDDLQKHINDEFWNPRMVDIGRHVLGIKKIKAA